MESVKRPLSPHLQVYKPQLTSILSITHRGTGVLLSIGSLFLSCWLIGLATSEEAFANLQLHWTAWYGKILLIGFVFSIFYHLCNGIRHLFWDTGKGLEISTAYKSGYAVITFSIILTIVTVIMGGVL
ncbi:MAG: succinate dehydrogenase, cytochrome b556 subunit [Proteobacteria bacterium]|nr:succinate dehydrogenase, cytochrome b556 subunit [Pseudomonadota bacterium]NOG59027.1 succinate dehydrogenase, cytochrome b556 subunit [Pseudomonadota bacterium]